MRQATQGKAAELSRRAFLAATVLAVNMLGDGLRDLLDPRVSKHI